MSTSQAGSKQSLIQKEGVVTQALPGAQFRVSFEEHDGVADEVLAHLSGNMKRHFIKVSPGDKVSVEFSPYDLTRGRITRRN